MKVEILSHTPNGDKLIAAAAKLCYSSAEIATLWDGLTQDKAESFLDMLSSIGHESPFEHVSVTFGIEGVSRAVLAQITRHRIASFSVQSQRYVNKEHFTYIIPPAILNNPEALAEFTAAMEEDRAHYIRIARILTAEHKERLIADGADEKTAEKTAQKAAFENARSVLPNACDTKIIMTMNVRSLYNFFALRCCNRAQWEIRTLAVEMLRLCRNIYPKLFEKAGPPCITQPCPEGKMSCGKIKEVRESFSSF
ncbi:MAG: thymidylate synthase (FAD) [Firmicutes bacterium HGW-Firmicutes-21]|nr:MAG: thymidylate synthase (FAD) [Firmicutes bacterium HGW-Firmicutes-21]